MRKICYVSGTRADFGLMASTLSLLHQHPDLDLAICATAQHLSPTYGNTISAIEAAGLRICAKIPVDLTASSGASMATAVGHEIIGMVTAFEQEKPDLVLLLGDRGETLAGALAAVHLNIPIVHIHGGERSGTVDEMVRHAISKLAHYHFVATENSRERLIRMGEQPENIYITGAPGLDGIAQDITYTRLQLCQQVDLDPQRPIGLFVFHPVVQEINTIAQQTHEILTAALRASLQLVCLTPNSDAGGAMIHSVLTMEKNHPDLRLFVNMPRNEYLSWMAAADLMLGNSSSAIIEAASLHLAAINIGSRQNIREQSENIVNVQPDADKIFTVIQQLLALGKRDWNNVYGDGKAGERMIKLLTTLPLTHELLSKSNAY